MLKVHLKLLFLILFINNLNSQQESKNILFVGHAYGSHKENDNQLDPTFKNYYDEYNSEYDKVVLGGDFIYDCNNDIEIENFKKFFLIHNVNFVIGNHDNCNSIFELTKYKNNDYHELIYDTLIFYLNTSKTDGSSVESLFNYVQNTINENSPENVIIFTHQLIFSNSDWYVRVNSRKYYEYGNTLYQKIYEKYFGKTLPFLFVAGDLGAYDFTPHTFYHNDSNFTMLSSGIGNSYNSKAIKIKLNKKVEYSIVDLLSGNEENVNKYSKSKVQLYQFPKLVLSIIKRNYLLSISFLIIFILVYLTKIKSY